MLQEKIDNFNIDKATSESGSDNIYYVNLV